MEYYNNILAIESNWLINSGIISEANYQSLLRVLRETTSIGTDGRINIDDLNGLLSKDPGALATLRRLGDYVSNEVIQKNTLGDAFLWEGSHKNPFFRCFFPV